MVVRKRIFVCKNINPRLVKKRLIAFFVLVCGFSFSLFAYDAVTLVQYPLLGRPAFVLPGNQFSIECKTSAETSGWSATLSMLYKEIPLSITAGEYKNGVRTLTAAVPSDAPYELYDLRVLASNGVDDKVDRCVRVVKSFDDDFTFVHLPDCHLPAVSWIGFYDDANTVPEFRQIIREINILQPDFVLQTGDLVDNGQDESQYRLAQEMLEECEVPVFLTGGNHDLWYSGHTFWNRYFGTAMNYGFTFGPCRFLGLEMYDIPSKTFTADQMKWLMASLDASVQSGDKSRILFTHYDESRQITGDFVDRYSVDGLFYGHTHINGEQRLGLRQALKLNTSYTMNNNGEYRLVKIRGGKITETPLFKFKRLRMDFSPANDGASGSLTARIFNANSASLPGATVKLCVRRDMGSFSVTGGDVVQSIDYGSNQRVYYVTVDVPAMGSAEVSVVGSAAGDKAPAIAAYSPKFDTTLAGGQSLRLEVQAAGQNMRTAWKRDGNAISGETGPVLLFRPEIAFSGKTVIQCEVSNAAGKDIHTWTIYAEKTPSKPQVVSSTRNFYPIDQEAVIGWTEPVEGSGVFEYGPAPGQIVGSIPEEGGQNRVRFTPASIGMGLGLYSCRIRSGGLSSDWFSLVVESAKAPAMIGPIGDKATLTPVFQWDPVQGVPYYLLILTDQEIIITENQETGDYSLEGANPIWAVLTAEHSVPYGAPDPSGAFTSFPAPLSPGSRYWWVVLNCYGNKAELASTVQSGVATFRVALPGQGLSPPVLLAPTPDATIEGSSIIFKWNAVTDAVAYAFYPFKIEEEEGVEVVRPIWETPITTTNTAFELDALRRLVKGEYLWKAAAVDRNGNEFPSEPRRFRYEAPSAMVNLRTFDNRGTAGTGDDMALPRVGVSYEALSGVDMGLPLSTDKQGERLGLLFTPGVYAFAVHKEGFAPYADTLTLSGGQTVALDVRMTPDLAALTGRVVDEQGNAVEAAGVAVRHSLHKDVTRESTSDRNGTFTVSIGAGPWIVSASKSGYQASPEFAVTIQSGEVTALSSPLVVRKNANQIKGNVVNGTGQPVYGAAVEIRSGAVFQNVVTDADGRFNFSVQDGSWLLTASKNGFSPASGRWVSVRGGKTVEVSPSPELIPSGSLIDGTVSDGLHELSGAVVKAVPASGSAITGQSDGYGLFTLAVPPGYYRLFAERAGFCSSRWMDLSIASNEAVTGVVLSVAEASAEISGQATSDGFTPLAGVAVSAGEKTVLTDAGGRYSIVLPPGKHRIGASKSGYLNSRSADVSVVPRQRLESIDFLLAPNASVISGNVTSSGNVVAYALVEAPFSEVRTNENGFYSLNVNKGTQSYSVAKTGFKPSVLSMTVGQAQVLGWRDVSLIRGPARIQGRVKAAPSGTPLMGVGVDVLEADVSTISKADGTVALELDPSNKGYTLRFSKEGIETRTHSTGPILAGQTASFEVTLNVFPTLLTGLAVDETGEGVGLTVVTAEGGGNAYSCTAGADGRFRLSLPPEGGLFRISATRNGYVQKAGPETAALSPGGKKNMELLLETRFARLNGKVSSANERFVTRAKVQLTTDDGVAASTASDESGLFDFVDTRGRGFLSEGVYDLTVGKPGYGDTLITGVSLAGGAVKTLDVSLKRCEGTIEGRITDGTNPVVEATVEARPENTQDRFTRITDENGVFRLDRIPAGRYLVGASRSGYTFLRDTAVTAPVSGLNMILVRNRGRFWGRVLDWETGMGVAAGLVANDGCGNESRTLAAADGSYDMQLLPTLHSYTFTVYASGYATVARENVSAERGDTTLFRLRRIYGSVEGRVTLKPGGAGVPNIPVRTTAGSTVFIDTTDGNGLYRSIRLPVNQYYVTLEKAGHLPSPAFRSVGLWNGENKTGLDFELEKVELASLAISGPASVASGGKAAYSYSAKTSDGRSMPITAQWSVDLPAAVDSMNAAGVLALKSDFLGPITVRLRDIHSGIEDSATVHAVADLLPNDGERIFQDYRGALFFLPSGCVAQSVSFGVKYPAVPDAKRLSPGYEALGRVLAFHPDGMVLAKSMELVLPLPEAAGESAVLGRWNPIRLRWETVQGEAVRMDDVAEGAVRKEDNVLKDNVPNPDSLGLRAESQTLTQWTILEPSQSLGLREFEAKPNPFSPFLESLKLSFVPTSNASSMVFVTAVFYNMNGEPVRNLVVGGMFPKGRRAEIIWDGRTDSGALAMNGRYLVSIEAKDGTGVEKKLLTVVLVK